MKFKLLSIGQKFEYDGDIYVKTSPLIASNVKTSENKMIPRYAPLILLGDTGKDQQKVKKETINTQEILSAFNIFYEKCITALEDNNVLVPLIKDKIDKARDEFTQHLTQNT